MRLTTDLSALHPRVRQQIIRGLHHEDTARYALGAVQQVSLKRHADAVAAAKYKGEFRAQMVMSQDQWMRAMNDYGQTCFMDPEFVPWLLKKHEDMRVKDSGERIQSGWTAGRTGDDWRKSKHA